MASAVPPNFSWVVPGLLAGLAMPRLPAHYQYMYENGIRHLVSLTERSPPYHDTCPGIQVHRLRIADFCPPSHEQIQRFLQIVEDAGAKKEVAVLQSIRERIDFLWLEQGRIHTVWVIYPSLVIQSQGIVWAKAMLQVAFSGCSFQFPSLPSTRTEAVAVHCLLGFGRTGTMLACYLVKTQKITGVDAIHEIRKLRHGSIETHDQEKAVVQFYQRIK